MKPGLALGWIGLLVTACEARSIERPSPARVDKQAVFGSASLVPTREGERARRELATAGELEQALDRLGLGPAHVDVELRDPTAVIVIARGSERDEATVIELTRALIPELEPANLHVWWQPTIAETPAPAQDREPRSWALMLACLGLGVSVGIVAERLRSRW